MNCASFDLWLDGGQPTPDAASARAHAKDCARCARSLEALVELEAALGSAVSAPPGFTESVMARVAGTPQHPAPVPSGSFALPPLASPLPWWVRAMAQPAALLAAVLAALLIGYGDQLVRSVAAVAPLAARSFDGAPWLGDPRVAMALAVTLAPTMIWLSRRLFSWGRQLST